jgi:hypothetical protein
MAAAAASSGDKTTPTTAELFAATLAAATWQSPYSTGLEGMNPGVHTVERVGRRVRVVVEHVMQAADSASAPSVHPRTKPCVDIACDDIVTPVEGEHTVMPGTLGANYG